MGPFAFGTKCIWDIWHWDKSLDFGIFLGQKALGQNVSGTNYLGAKGQWDNSPRDNASCIKTVVVPLLDLCGMGHCAVDSVI